MIAYADTSFLVSLFRLDANSMRATSAINRLKPNLLLTPLGGLEIINALELQIFRKETTRIQANAAKAVLAENTASGFFVLQSMPENVYIRAEQIARRYGSRLGVRTLDILHVTSAVLLRPEMFISFDLRQLKLARACGLKTL
ncbi:MAG TPA: type II toxin-antitoxin system VapC family toxin [Terriglobia bacterium]|nr:type II toxin-antitoxin system VapC family toxin [Terriglobia bacterium]